ncbi:uncharacterized protein DUF2510 [Homoserinimonas aerilata]|uniref:Uncharacterized protein DUF2510 n=1 Tax=Homoserinimonas aerilata TaxID=1162970 RepID=A0A542YG91_9MICO|nr:DUF2510 domain-containing protein [Homoserinimonas aerilata]TQL47083.1 uncharacterized protein DUF2510 [Homoserinimonas aerilata]
MPDLQHIRLPAGWYPDPDGGDHRRWWDGKAWTQHTAPFQRPAPVYDVDDLAELRAKDAVVGSVKAPRRIRTAVRIGGKLAALAHKLPFSRPRDDEQEAAEASAEAGTETGAGAPAKAAPRPRSTPARAAKAAPAAKKSTGAAAKDAPAKAAAKAAAKPAAKPSKATLAAKGSTVTTRTPSKRTQPKSSQPKRTPAQTTDATAKAARPAAKTSARGRHSL